MGGNRKEFDDIDNKDEHERTNRPLLDSSNSPQSINMTSKSNENTDQNDTSVIIKSPLVDTVKDKYFMVYGIFLLFGIACLLPWNVFITATEYFVDYKLNTNISANATYRGDFMFYITNISQITNVLMNLINICVTFGGNPKNRIPYAIMLCSFVIIFHISLAIVNSSTWPLTFFILCCISVFVMFVATGVMNSCVYYVSSIFPPEYINAIILGNNLAGIFTSVTSILSKKFTSNLRLAAIYYFLAAFIILMCSFIGYFLMHRTNFYKHHNRKAEENKRKSIGNTDSRPRVPYLKIIKKTWLLLFCIWLNFFSTLAIFPVFQLGVRRCSEDFIISNKSYQDVLTFLTFNFLVTIGNMIPKVVRKPGPKWIPVPVIIRAVLVFLFFSLSNFKPEQRNNIPILIKNDYVYWLGCILSPLSFGYLTSLLMMYVPSQMPEQAGSVSMIAGLIIAIGVSTGLQFTKILEFIVLA